MRKTDKIELLAPAGNMERLKTAFHFNADAVYLAGKNFGLRAFSDNFTYEELKAAIDFTHALNKRAYVTLNIFAFDDDIERLKEYIQFLESIKADAVIVSDLGVFDTVKKTAPSLEIHISTQSNTMNAAAAKVWAQMGAERIVLARELNLTQIRKIRDSLPDEIVLEAFVHGAMCISYSGRCLLSNYLSNRPSNRGECAQSCRWEYTITEKTRRGEEFEISEDNRGTYILNSKDLNMLAHIDKLADAGIESFKIEGRVKTAYYVANTVNAYRRAIDLYYKDRAQFSLPQSLAGELYKSSHRQYTTGFYFNEKDTQCLSTSKPEGEYKFCAVVIKKEKDGFWIEQRNRFKSTDTLEILSPSETFNKTIVSEIMLDEEGRPVTDALLVQQKLFIKSGIDLKPGDILRMK